MFYKRDFWDKTAAFYDFAEGFNGKVYRKMTSAVKRLTQEGGAVLECAAGTGERKKPKRWSVPTAQRRCLK